MRTGATLVGLGQVLVQFKRLVEIADRLGVLSRGQARIAALALGLGVIRLQPDHGVEVLDRAGEVMGGDAQVRPLSKRMSESLGLCDGLVVIAERLVAPAEALQGAGQVAVSLGVAPFQLDRFAVSLGGLGVVVGLGVRFPRL